MPEMALSGVRISCDMLARKALFATLAASAASLVAINARSTALRSLISTTKAMMRSGNSSAAGTKCRVTSTGNRRPSHRRLCVSKRALPRSRRPGNSAARLLSETDGSISPMFIRRMASTL